MCTSSRSCEVSDAASDDGKCEEIISLWWDPWWNSKVKMAHEGLWKYKFIDAHQGPLDSKESGTQRIQPTTSEFIGTMGRSSHEPLRSGRGRWSCHVCHHTHGIMDLLRLTGLATRFKRLARRAVRRHLGFPVNQRNLKSFRNQVKYKFGVRIPCDHNQANEP